MMVKWRYVALEQLDSFVRSLFLCETKPPRLCVGDVGWRLDMVKRFDVSVLCCFTFATICAAATLWEQPRRIHVAYT